MVGLAQRGGLDKRMNSRSSVLVFDIRGAMQTGSISSSDLLDASVPLCPKCGYSLRGISSEQCPECGATLDWETLARSHLPWEHRKSLGWWRAYWRMNRLAILRPGKLAAEIDRPVSLAIAKRYRNLTVLWAWLASAGWSVGPLAARLGMFEGRSPHVHGLGWWMEGVTVLASAFASWLAFYLISDAASFFFNPRSLPVERRDRAVALSYYAQSALAWLWVPSVLAGLGIAVQSQKFHDGTEQLVRPLLTASFCLYVGIALLYWIETIMLMRRVIGGQPARTVAMAIYQPIAWFVLFGVCGLIPLAVAYISLIILSFS
jgi:hypothetical protein